VYVATPFITHCVRKYGWRCDKTHGNQYQKGFPDYFFSHPKYSARWVEIKRLSRKADGSLSQYASFTDAQKNLFPAWLANNVGIWVIAHDDLREKPIALEEQYQVLFRPHNCFYFLNSIQRRMCNGY